MRFSLYLGVGNLARISLDNNLFPLVNPRMWCGLSSLSGFLFLVLLLFSNAGEFLLFPWVYASFFMTVSGFLTKSNLGRIYFASHLEGTQPIMAGTDGGGVASTCSLPICSQRAQSKTEVGPDLHLRAHPSVSLPTCTRGWRPSAEATCGRHFTLKPHHHARVCKSLLHVGSLFLHGFHFLECLLGILINFVLI